MSPPNDGIPDLDQMLESLVWGELSPADTAALERLLASSEAARDYYRRYINLHVMLEATSVRAPGVNLPALTSTEVVTVPLGGLPANSVATGFEARRSPPSLWSAIAVSSVLVCYFLMLAGLLIWDGMHHGADHGQLDERDGRLPATVLSEALDGNWTTGESIHRHRTLELRSGQAELEFDSGARVVVQGPAQFVVRSGVEGYLRHGKLSARVPQRAVGFAIETPTSRIVDLGTEFEVAVSEQGGTEVHVLTGTVIATPQNVLARGGLAYRPTRLSAGQGLRVPASPQPALLLQSAGAGAYRVEGSVPVADAASAQHAAGPKNLPVLSPGQLSELRLWLRADEGIITDRDGHVQCWTDQSPGGLSAVQSERKCRPRIVHAPDGAAFPVVEFDGIDDLLEGPSLGTNMTTDFSLMVVFRVVAAKPLGGIFSLRDQAHADWNSFSGLAIAQSHAGKSLRVVQGECAQFGPRVSAEHDSLSFDPRPGEVPDGLPMIVILNKGHGVATLWLNGEEVGIDRYAMQFPADMPPAFDEGFFLGARSDNGGSHAGKSLFSSLQIAEVVLCRRALSADEIMQIGRYLSAKYLNGRNW